MLPLSTLLLCTICMTRCSLYAKQVFNLVHVFSNYGELRLRPASLVAEHAYLTSAATLDSALRLADVHVLGELCHCLRVFGEPLPPSCLEFLLSAQRPKDGGWPTRDGDEMAYTKYHAAMCATMALYEPCFRGFGPGSKPLKDLSEKWYPPKAVSSAVVEGVYTDQPSGGLEERALARLLGLVQWHQVMEANSMTDPKSSAPAKAPTYALSKDSAREQQVEDTHNADSFNIDDLL